MSDELVIVSYQCPLCGNQIFVKDTGGFYTDTFESSVWWLYDRTPCCGVWVAWLPIDGILLYVGTFRNDEDFRLWAASCGARQGGRLTGETWSVAKQRREYDDEIPF